jgi:hypothetical protein
MGFWNFSCATSSLRNVSLPNWSVGPPAVASGPMTEEIAVMGELGVVGPRPAGLMGVVSGSSLDQFGGRSQVQVHSLGAAARQWCRLRCPGGARRRGDRSRVRDRGEDGSVAVVAAGARAAVTDAEVADLETAGFQRMP